MRLRKLTCTLALGALVLAVLAFAPGRFTPLPRVVLAQSERAARHCVPVGGMLMTNVNVIANTTNLGPVTGDLSGSVAAAILKASPGPDGTTLLDVQHFWVTEAGDTIRFDVAHGMFSSVTPTRLAVIKYPATIVGGTGKFAGATGTIDTIGEVDLPNYPDLAGGRTVFRYSGQVCFKPPNEP
jgi:hypothetical protein